jgi:tRNA A37 threonylcarbamoyladenosine biosynthesis protein TsaE
MYSNHNTQQILQSFIDKRYVTLIEWNDSVLNSIPKRYVFIN